MTIPEHFLRIRAELGSDHDAAMRLLNVLAENPATEFEITEQIGIDLPEVMRLLSKLRHLGLVE